MAKGLEFDEVVIPDADTATYHSDYDRSLLYIACTRAMHKLTLLHTGERSRLIGDEEVNDGREILEQVPPQGEKSVRNGQAVKA